MKEIKFRAWKHRESPEMINDIDFIDWKNGIVGFPYQLSRDTFREDEENINNMILMQSTGLKDKNGVEIYEGDILPSNYSVFSKGELKVQVVRFLDGGFRRLSVYQEWGSYGAYGEPEVADWHDGECLSEVAAMETEVLGNIYENPELLEEAE